MYLQSNHSQAENEDPHPSAALASAWAATAEIALVADSTQAIYHVSPAFTAMTGYEEADLVGLNCRVLQGPGTDAATRRRIRDTLRAHKIFEGQILNYRKDGAAFWAELKIIPIRMGVGPTVTHYVSFQRDISSSVALLKHLESQPAPDHLPGVPMLSASEQNKTEVVRTSPEDYRAALRDGNVLVHFQPVVDLRDGSVHLFEALARLQLPVGRVAYPQEFLPHLGAGDLRNLYSSVLDQALEVVAAWDRNGARYDLSVNLPPEILQDGTIPRLTEKLLQTHNIAPSRLGLELLESQTMKLASQSAALQELMDLGVGLAMDDLGAGYSTLQRLSSFPFNAIKLDRGLLFHTYDKPVETFSIIATLIQMGKDLQMNVVIEGLEDEGLTEAAILLGAPLGQGYYFAKPMAPHECVHWHDSFDLELHRSPIRTALGALAYHWQFARAAAPHPEELPKCPLTRFLHQAAATEEVHTWHSLQHSKHGTHLASSRNIIEWLTQRIRASTSSSQGAPS